VWVRPNCQEELGRLLAERVLVLDGAMGTMVQRLGLTEGDFRGERFSDHPCDLQGDNDLLVLTRPDAIRAIHEAYLAAGADIIETCTFNATALSQADYGAADLVREINRKAARLARGACDAWTARTPGRPRFVAGSIGPTNKTLSISPSVEDPAYRAVTFAQVRAAYAEQVRGLIEGGVDILLVETIFDALNAKAALFAIEEQFMALGGRLPVMISASVTDRSGRTLAGQTLEAFWIAVEHARPFSIGLNCSFGARELKPLVAELARFAPIAVSVYPNAGLPNACGAYDEPPEETARLMRGFVAEGLANIVGGCCGTTPEHIRAIAEAVVDLAPRKIPVPRDQRFARFSGLEPLVIRPDSNLQMIGERTNVAGSRRFAQLIRAQDYAGALAVALNQVRGGANMLDVNMDEPLIDAPRAMEQFLRLVAGEPEIARLPIMIDSSRWEVIEAGLQCLAGKGVVNSLSLKDGEEEFLRRARLVRRYGAGVVAIACDETGQAETAARKVAILRRAYRLLTQQAGFSPEEIILDPAVLAVATGLEEHRNYAVAFIEAVRLLKSACPGALISGGISNLSFAFRGNDVIRQAMHSVFLYHAVAAGLDLGIVNAGQLAVFEEIPPELRERVEDVLFNRRPDAAERLSELAAAVRGPGVRREVDLAWRTGSVAQRLQHALVHGVVDYLEADLAEARAIYPRAIDIIEGPLMDALKHIGDLFGTGMMFLPQVVKSARAMRHAVGLLEAQVLAEGDSGPAAPAGRARGRVVIATVRGDVHDIGKNIVGVILGCGGHEVIDLGVMVPADRILATAAERQADAIGLSGLITPSLEEMAHVAGEMERRGLQCPLLIGGATTSRRHTAVRIAPECSAPVVHVRDASRVNGVLAALLDGQRRETFLAENRAEQEALRRKHAAARERPLVPFAEACSNKLRLDWAAADLPAPEFAGRRVVVDVPIATLIEYIDWTFFFRAWDLPGRYPRIMDHPQHGAAARELYADAQRLLEEIEQNTAIAARGVYGFWPAAGDGEDIVLYAGERRERELLRFNLLRQQERKASGGAHLSLADFVAPAGSGRSDYIGAFAVTGGIGARELAAKYERDRDDYRAIMVKALADRLAEALAEHVHERARRDWQYGRQENLTREDLLAGRYRGIRPAFGYPACPDHSEKFKLFELLAAPAVGITLTERGAMDPAASLSGLHLAHREARYFAIGRLGRDQVRAYAARKGKRIDEVERWLASHLDYDPE